MRIDTSLDAAKDTAKAPEQFTPQQWVTWWESVLNYFGSIRGASSKPISYIARKAVPPAAFPDERTHEMYQMPLAGEAFTADNTRAFRELKALTIGTEAWSWIQVHDTTQNGREACVALMDHYDGAGEVTKRYNWAVSEVKDTHYKGNETIYPFSKFASKLREAYTTMQQSDRPETQAKQVEQLLEKMQVEHHQKLVNIKMEATRRHPDNFVECVNFISAEISQHIKPAAKSPDGKRKRYVSATETGGRGRGRGRGRGGGRGDGRGGRGRGRGGGRDQGGHGGGILVYGVDITNPDRFFTSDEMNRLGREGQRILYDRRDAIRARGDGRGDGRGRGRHVAAAGADRQEDSTQGQVQQQEEQSGRGSNRGGRNGARFGRGRYNEGGRG